MPLFYNVNDPHDRPEDIREAALRRPDVIASHDFAAELRKMAWDNRHISNTGNQNVGSDLQWYAKIPGAVADLWDLRYPAWRTDDDLLEELLSKHPECRTVPEDLRK
jgi:hypothetical protein